MLPFSAKTNKISKNEKSWYHVVPSTFSSCPEYSNL